MRAIYTVVYVSISSIETRGPHSFAIERFAIMYTIKTQAIEADALYGQKIEVKNAPQFPKSCH